MSDNSYINSLHEKRREADEAARGIVDRAHAEQRANLTAEEEASWRRADAEVRELDESIRAVRERDARERETDLARASINAIVRPEVRQGISQDVLDRFIREPGNGAFEIDFRGLKVNARGGMIDVESRDVFGYSGGGTLGSLVPTYTARDVYYKLLDIGAFWRLNPYIVNTPDGNPRNFPKVSNYGTATITAEGVAMTEADPTLAGIHTAPFGYKHITYISNELIADSAVDVAGLVLEQATVAVNRTLGSHACLGGGTTEPQGYHTGGSVVLQAAGTITPMNVIALQHKIGQQYRAGAAFVTNDGVASYLRQYRATGGTDGPFLIQPPTAPGMPETIFGAPLVIDNFIPAHGSAIKSMAYGNFNSGILAHTSALRFERSRDHRFDKDETSFRIVWRVDTRVRDNTAYGLYQATAN